MKANIEKIKINYKGEKATAHKLIVLIKFLEET
jgi:hypothetical protein